MRRQPSLRAVRAAGAGTLGVAILATGASAVAQATETQPDAQNANQLKLADRELALGQQVVATGRLAGAAEGAPVALEFRPRTGGAWTAVASGVTTAGGAFRLSGKVDRNGVLRVVPGAAARAAANTTTPDAGGAVARIAVHAKVTSTAVRSDVLRGRSAVVRGQLRPGGAGRTVVLQARKRGHWRALDHDRTSASGAYALRYRPSSTGSWAMRVLFRGDSQQARAYHRVGRLKVYRPAMASWYGPGFYGGHLACGGTLTPGTLGVANKTLPCGAKVTLRHGGRTVTVPVIDRGPYVGRREFDLTAATKARLGFGSTGTVWSTR